MTEPLALVVYEKLLPGTQLLNRLQDLKYRARPVTDASTLPACARQEHPMVVVADLSSTRQNVCEAVARMKLNPETRHIPVIAFAGDDATELQAAARAAGAELVVSESAILNHLTQFLEQALRVE